eukprot:gene45921-61384_t
MLSFRRQFKGQYSPGLSLGPDASELAGIPWLQLLTLQERDKAVAELRVGDVAPGDFVCRLGRPVTYWFGVVEGLLKMSSDNDQ